MDQRIIKIIFATITILAPWWVMADQSVVEVPVPANQSLQTQSIQKAEIHQLVDGFHQAAAHSRFDDYFAKFSRDAYFLGTDASERWSVDEFKAYARLPFEQGRGWRYEVLQRQVESSPEANVYWFDEILMNKTLGRCRGTGVVIQESGQWKIAHYSLTLLIPNDIADQVGQDSMRADRLVD